MSEEPRRSGRATKGQHKNASSSPAPNPNPKPAKSAKSRPAKQSTEPEPDEDDEDERIRCICGNEDAKDKRAFIGCDACTVWQHNVCMGVPEDEEDVPEHYFCEECRPEEHQETLQALAKAEKIWEVRNKIWQNERKSKNRKGKGGKGDDVKPGWLKKDVPPVNGTKDENENADVEVGSKRKRVDVKEVSVSEAAEKPERGAARQDKRRKSSQAETKVGPDMNTALVEIDQLPSDRQKIAQALSKTIAEGVSEQVKSGFRIPDGHTAKSLGDYHAVRIEYALTMNHDGPQQEKYKAQFRTLLANFKQNKVLVDSLLRGALTADDLSVMESKDLASAELQKERAAMKEELDRQVVAVQEEGPRMHKTHKGDEMIEDDTDHANDNGASAQPVRERASLAEDDGGGMSPSHDYHGSPIRTDQPALVVDTKRPSDANMPRRQSSQQFDMSSIWAKTAHSPTSGTANPLRPMQQKPRRRSSVVTKLPQEQSTDDAKDDPDIDRMLQDTNDDDEAYSPADYSGADGIVWRGRLVQSSSEGEPTVNARFVAGRDLGPAVTWKELLPEKLQIDGRLQVAKAEEYLCGLQWSTSSDVSVLSFTPYDDAQSFNNVFSYFQSRQRYAVVNKDKPGMVKDLYIIPVEKGGKLPEHIEKLEHCMLKLPIEERLLLATFVIARAPGTPQVAADITTPREAPHGGQNGQQQQPHLPQHVRGGGPGPSGSPLTSGAPTFSPGNNAGLPSTGYGASPASFPPYPYGQQGESHAPPTQAPPAASPPHANPLVQEVLGQLQYAPTAQQIVAADPNIGREKLENLRRILEQDVNARTNIESLASRLFSQ